MRFGSGSNNPNWRGGRNISTKGYPRIHVGKKHPISHGNGYAYEHLLVWVSAGNAIPERGKEIHRINENKEDNRIENLELINKRRHSNHHSAEKPRLKNGRFVGKSDD